MRFLARLSTPLLVLMLTLGVGFSASFTAACHRSHPIDTPARVSLALAKAIGEAQVATKQLTDANLPAFPPERALKVQESLLKANTELGKLPQFIRLAATAQEIQAGAATSTPAQIDAWITILNVVSKELGLVIGGLPVDSVARQALEASRAAQQTATTFILELEKLKASLKQE